jgi:beta-glucosidase
VSIPHRSLLVGVIVALATQAQQPIPEKQVQNRVDALLKQMTLAEKIGQLNQLFVLPQEVPGMPALKDEDVARGDYGSLLFVSDAAQTNRLQHIAVEKSRLHIPLLFGLDVIHGFKTVFPVPIAMAASWDPATVERAQAVAAREASAAGVRWSFAPMVDIARDARWGRIVEGAGEDPFLGAAMARAQVRGFQGSFAGEPGHVLTSVKHFAGYGAADGGRDYDSSYISDEELWNVYLPPFDAAVKAGSATVMSAYMDLNGVPATGNRFLLKEVLRDTWGFKGFVVSDAFAVRDLVTHGFASDAEDAAYRAFSAGVNMDMGSRTYDDNLQKLLKDGRLKEAQIDEMVKPILAAKIRLGLFENPYVDAAAAHGVFDDGASKQEARRAAQRTAVLLRNEGSLLPLAKARYSSIAVIGPMADSAVDVRGPWALADDPTRAISIARGIREKVGTGVRVETAMGCEIRRKVPSMFDAITGVKKETPLTEEQNSLEIEKAVALASKADLAVMVLGETQDMSGEAASRTSLDLPGRQEELLEKVVALGKPVVLVLINGRPLSIRWAAEHVAAILEAWYPGAEGGDAVADLLFGDANPGGKLPVTFPRSVGQVPIYYAHTLTHKPEDAPDFVSRYWDEPSTPLYRFGYGLSYTKFTIADLKVDKDGASVEVENSGSRAGDEVVQLYLHQRAGSASRPARLLKGFERVTLAPGEKKTVRFTLSRDELSYWSAAERKWVQDGRSYDIWVGSDSNATLHAEWPQMNTAKH